MSISQTINQLKLDNSQLLLIEKLNQIVHFFNQKSFFNILRSCPFKSGIYIYGGVGRGKTMIMQAFFNELKINKKMMHYQDFMQLVHQQLYEFQSNNIPKPLTRLASYFSKTIQVLCLDELEIKDIADAMIVGGLFEELIRKKIFFVITSNNKPDNLYLDGLQRQSFLKFIDILNINFNMFHLINDLDYRLNKISNIHDNKILYPLDQSNIDKIKQVILEFTGGQTDIGIIKVFGRNILFKQTTSDILVTDFEELFLRDIGYIDYINICQKYKIIILQNIIRIEANHSDLITRFINFIDNAYFYKVLLFATMEVSPQMIYPQGQRITEFQRTLSRLAEMNSESYLKY
ncbi:MAG: cell division protein ZapE [Rickettsiaceae bacterium]|nr:MAG: cell division protein ZapE [Rickettsiaceae bacterium]